MQMLFDSVKIRLILPSRYFNLYLAVPTILYTHKSMTWSETRIIGENKQREQAWQTGSFQLPWSYAHFCHQTVLKICKSPDEGLEVGRKTGRWGVGDGRRKRSEDR